MVSRPTKCAEMRITGMCDSVTPEEVIAAVDCPRECVKIGSLRCDSWGHSSIWVSCPVAAAQKLGAGGRLLVGWVLAQATLLKLRPMRSRSRIAEDAVRESKEVTTNPQVSSIDYPKLAPAVGRKGNLPANSTPNASEPRPRRTRCNFCRMFGHSAEECRNREKAESSIPITNNNNNNGDSRREIRCYGCGKVGVVRSKCDVCNGDSKKTTDFNVAVVDSKLSRCRYDVEETSDIGNNSEIETLVAHAGSAVTYKSASHPLININVMGRSGVAIIDTGATHCIASPSLYKIMLDSGVEFREIECGIRLADGSRVERKLLEAEVPVTLEGREVSADFLVLPGDETRTLLGVEFLSRAGMVVDVAHSRWTFANEPERPHDFVRECPLSSSAAELMRAES
ncbi:Retrovirus-related Pol polyprotein from transposon 17.6, partial [Operophtera brumata]